MPSITSKKLLKFLQRRGFYVSRQSGSHLILHINKDMTKRVTLPLHNKDLKPGTDLIFVGLTPVDDSKVDPIPWKPESSYRLEYVQKYEEILKGACKEQNLPFIELMSRFMGKDFKTLLADGLHPNTEGHQVIYEEVKKNW